ncbi:MAG: hypothetical protein ABIO70_10025 [Pseudomonadota bacterium]
MRRPVKTLVAFGLANFAIIGSALAAEDVSLSALGQWNGTSVDPTIAGDAYGTVVNQLGLAVANKPMAPGETLGVFGFEVGLASTVAFNETKEDNGDPSPWERVHESGAPKAVLWIPWLQARKGLPLSFEIGGNLGYIAFSHQTVFGGYGRWAPWEGYHPIPDLSLQVGYSGYVGNDELELGALDWSATLGYTLPFGTLVGINQAQFSPYLGIGQVVVHAAPRLAADEQEALGIEKVSGFKGSDFYVDGFRHLNLAGGFRIVSGSFHLLMAASFAPGTLTSLSGGLGFTY